MKFLASLNKIKNMKLKGSATLVVIMSAIIAITYATSTSADVRHMKYMQEKYEKNIRQIYEEDIEYIDENFEKVF